MPFTRGDIDAVSQVDLDENERAEGMFIDYKRDLYGSADGDMKEFLKDVTSSQTRPAVTSLSEWQQRLPPIYTESR